MKTWIVNIETRKHDGDDIIGPFSSLEGAREAALKVLNITEEEWKSYDKYDSSFEENSYYSEEVMLDIFEREMQ